jgi:hypothetical protein
MDWVGIVSIIGGIASIIGAAISIWQSFQAKKAKDASVAAQEATEVARDKILQNIQYENFVSFQKECEKFGIFLHKASKNSSLQGKSANYVEDELEKFVTSFNVEITKTKGADRDCLMECYNTLTAKRGTVAAGNRENILALLDDVRTLTRKVADLQMKNKLSV